MDISRDCMRCKVTKPLTDFSKMNGGKYGRNSVCKECKRIEGREAAKSGRWPSFTKEGQRAYALLKNYGITSAQYEDLWLHQDGKCALCKTEKPSARGLEWLAVDHDHDTGAIRGLLCEICNVWLGNYEELMHRAGEDRVKAYLADAGAWIMPVLPTDADRKAKMARRIPNYERDAKACTKCGAEKPIDEFTLNPGGYRKGACKECEAARIKAYYHSNANYRASVIAGIDRRRKQRRGTA